MYVRVCIFSHFKSEFAKNVNCKITTKLAFENVSCRNTAYLPQKSLDRNSQGSVRYEMCSANCLRNWRLRTCLAEIVAAEIIG